VTTTSKWILGIVALVAVIGIAGIVVFFSMIGSALKVSDDTYDEVTGSGDGQVALIRIEDVITDAEETVRQLKKFAKRSSVKAIVLRINSPGGGVVPSHEIYEQVLKISSEDSIPVVVSMGSVAASGGYYIACGATRIMANPGTITGSIGVISQFVNVQELLDKIGVSTTTIKSGKFKDIGSPTREMTGSELETLQRTIDDVYGQFVDIVVQSRNMPEDSVRGLADGRIYSGHQALTLGLVDTLGTLNDAVMLAAKLGGIDGEPRLVQERKREPLFDQLMGAETQKSLADLRTRLNPHTLLEYRMSF
jgi:protease IV